MPSRPTVEDVKASAYVVPTERPESDGTLEWDATTMVVVEVSGGGRRGIGYTYADVSTATLVRSKLADVVVGRDATDVSGAWIAMVRAIRNLGRPGVASMAISAVDVALWDLEARILDLPLVRLLGTSRPALPVYASGGFTSYPLGLLTDQLGGWAAQGFPRVKMKVGRERAGDIVRVRAARRAVGPDVELFVDANGAWDRKRALLSAEEFAQERVTWIEEPVTSDDLEGLRLIRDRAPAGMEVTAGEYGYDLPYFRRMLDAGAVDVLQADATRCAGITGFLGAAALCEASGVPLSAHCAPSLHVHVGCAVRPLRHAEYFHDHARIESLLFDGFVEPEGGQILPDLSRPGIGLELKREDARRYAA